MDEQTSLKKAAFSFPKLYNFPPFFTKQPNQQTYHTQLEAWRKIVLEYCRFYRIWALSLNGTALTNVKAESSSSEDEDEESEPSGTEGEKASVFKSTKINREVKGDFIMKIYESLIEKKEASWINEQNQRLGILIYWNSLEDWATMLMNWVVSTGQDGNVLTIYELQNGEAVQDQEFAGMATETLTRVISVLTKEGRARVLKDDDGMIAGVKFGS